MKRMLVVLIAVSLAGCAWPFHSSTGPSAADAVTYQLAGSNVTGIAAVTIATPTGAQVSQAPAGPTFAKVYDPVAGFSQFNNIAPNITVLGYGCFDVTVLVDAKVLRSQHGCGQPVTVSSAGQ
jgi:hypothetical protein